MDHLDTTVHATDNAEEEILTYTLPDEALEDAAGIDRRARYFSEHTYKNPFPSCFC